MTRLDVATASVYLRRSVPPSFFCPAFQRKEGVCAGVPEEWTGVVPTRANYAGRAIPDDIARALTDAYVGVENGLLLECDACEAKTPAAVFHAARPDVKGLIASDLPDLWEATASTTCKPELALVTTASGQTAPQLTRSNRQLGS
jgi:hypothetical protein